MSTSASGDAAPQKVDLERVGVPRLMFGLLRQRFTGKLTIDQPDPHPGKRNIWFRGGMPVYTDWISNADVLGEVLIREGLIDAATCEKILTQMATNRRGKRFGELLIESQVISPDKLARGLSQQCSSKLAQMFKVHAGEVELSHGEQTTEVHDALLLPVNGLGVIRAGIVNHYTGKQIRSAMGDGLTGSFQASAAFSRYREQFGFALRLESMLDRVVNGCSIEQLVAAGNTELRSLQVVYVAWVCQMLRTGLPPFAEPKQAPTPPPPRPKPELSTATASQVQTAAVPPESLRTTKVRVGSKAKVRPPTPKDGDSELEKELISFEKKLDEGVHAFALFGLELTAERKEIRSRWADLSRKFHPDSLVGEGLAHLRERVERVFAALSEAHGVLRGKESRAKLKSAVEASGGGDGEIEDPTTVVRNAFEAEFLIRDGDKLLKAGHTQRAYEFYQKAFGLSPEEPETKVLIAWCEFCLEGKSNLLGKTKLEVIAAVAKAHPKLARAYYFEGMIMMNIGLDKAAIESFNTALELDPKMVDAQRQMRAIRLKAQKKPEKKGFRRLFGK